MTISKAGRIWLLEKLTAALYHPVEGSQACSLDGFPQRPGVGFGAGWGVKRKARRREGHAKTCVCRRRQRRLVELGSCETNLPVNFGNGKDLRIEPSEIGRVKSGSSTPVYVRRWRERGCCSGSWRRFLRGRGASSR